MREVGEVREEGKGVGGGRRMRGGCGRREKNARRMWEERVEEKGESKGGGGE